MINRLSPVSHINFTSKKINHKKHPKKNEHRASIESTRVPKGNIYGIKINKPQLKSPLDQLIYQATDGFGAQYDKYTDEHLFRATRDKKWVYTNPSNALDRSLEDAINSNLTLVYGKNIPKSLPQDIKTPNYGDNWGRHANYIEINNRAIANMDGNRTNSSILNTIKLLPLIPPSHDKWANCLLISQLYPNIWGDGWNNNGENSLYGIKLENERLSDNIGWEKIGNKIFTPEEQVKAFNDLAHLRGFKTSFRMLISEDQIKIGDSGQFRWDNPEHVEAFIIACCKGVELGFDGIFFDSAKHVGGYDWGNYAGVGAVPEYDQMAYILHEVRKRTGRFDLSFSGEKIEHDATRYKNMGFNAGTSGINADSVEDVKNSSKHQKYCREFAWGPTVSDDNDTGTMSYEQRLRRITSSLFGYDNPNEKLPSFMQMHDLFPLTYETNTHELMLQNKNFSTDNAPHHKRLFAENYPEDSYKSKVANEFRYCYDWGNY